VTPRVVPELERRAGGRSSYAEFRSRGSATSYSTHDSVFWRYLTERGMVGFSEFNGEARLATLGDAEYRVLSRATLAGGGYLAPGDFDDAVTSVRRSRAVIGGLARELVTDEGTVIQLPSATTHGVATWTAENAAYTASDEVFSQVSLGAFKAATKVIVSEELVDDAAGDFDRFLADELGQRIAVLEETAFAAGDGSGKPLGVIHSSSGYTVVTAATGSSTGFKLADVRATYDALPVAYRANASWIFSPSAFSSLAGLTATGGEIVLPSLHAAEPSLFSRPVYVSPDFPAAAANARSAFFGDMSLAYTVRRVRGLGVQRVLEMHSDNGQQAYRAFERLDGRPTVLEAGLVLRNSAT
jgi:HK97 family phage major capsid protein